MWTNVLNVALPPQRHSPVAWLEHQEPVIHTAQNKREKGKKRKEKKRKEKKERKKERKKGRKKEREKEEKEGRKKKS